MVGDIEKEMSKTEGTTMESKTYSEVYDALDCFNFWTNADEDIYDIENDEIL